ncbi:MAG: phosphoribosylanthranilate isomerase [Anaerolineales bacterium]
MKIKICGITSLEDARTAIEAGADYLGFNFYPPSPRSILPEACAQITSVLRQEYPQVQLVGVFVNMPVAQVKAILTGCGLHLAQLHGDESVKMLAEFEGMAFKAVRLSTDSITDSRIRTDFKSYAQFRGGQAPVLLVDAAVKGAYGGTGVTADWSAAAELARRYPLLLAGGLTAENVGAAVRQVRPWGVDTASGVEASPGKKDAEKMKAFVDEIRKIDGRP